MHPQFLLPLYIFQQCFSRVAISVITNHFGHILIRSTSPFFRFLVPRSFMRYSLLAGIKHVWYFSRGLQNCRRSFQYYRFDKSCCYRRSFSLGLHILERCNRTKHQTFSYWHSKHDYNHNWYWSLRRIGSGLEIITALLDWYNLWYNIRIRPIWQ